MLDCISIRFVCMGIIPRTEITVQRSWLTDCHWWQSKKGGDTMKCPICLMPEPHEEDVYQHIKLMHMGGDPKEVIIAILELLSEKEKTDEGIS